MIERIKVQPWKKERRKERKKDRKKERKKEKGIVNIHPKG